MNDDEERKGNQKNLKYLTGNNGRFFTYRRFWYVAPLRDVFAGFFVSDPHPLFGCHFARFVRLVIENTKKEREYVAITDV